MVELRQSTLPRPVLLVHRPRVDEATLPTTMSRLGQIPVLTMELAVVESELQR